MRRRFLPLIGLVAAAGLALASPRPAGDAFDHELHEDVFPSCLPCHGDRTDADSSIWPDPAACRSCHDDETASLIDWEPPEPRGTNLRFRHEVHAEDVEAFECSVCHVPEGNGRMEIVAADAGVCMDCHDEGTPHLSADNDCAVCHLPLSESTLTFDHVGAFPKPASHEEEGFAAGGHGAACPADGASDNCATCHAQQFCLICHVDGPEVPAIAELARDDRALALDAMLSAPPDHAREAFLATHGFFSQEESAKCATCHTAESCEECHAATPHVAADLYRAGDGRGAGAAVSRRAPPSHGDDYRYRHAADANASSQSCAACHGQEDCLECHLPHAAEMSDGFHPADFLSRHPTAAWSRETSCSDCHDAQSFCASCHEASGLGAGTGQLGTGYHDGKDAFLLGHGPAARRNLETCVTCHSEPDCLQCHSAQRGRGFSPHGPGFDPEKARAANSESCTACHGPAIPR